MSKDDTIVLDGAGARDGIEERCSLLRENINSVKSDYEKEKLAERLAKLHSGVAVIKVRQEHYRTGLGPQTTQDRQDWSLPTRRVDGGMVGLGVLANIRRKGDGWYGVIGVQWGWGHLSG